jgi:hypothetical protein
MRTSFEYLRGPQSTPTSAGHDLHRLFDVAASNPEWEHVYCATIVAANTSMRPVEVKHDRRCDVDLVKRLRDVRRSKHETSHRVIPLNASAIEAVARMLELRHTVITELAEMGVADHGLESIGGHLSRRMLEHYSHIRIDATRQAFDALDAAVAHQQRTATTKQRQRRSVRRGGIDALVGVFEELMSQSRHSLRLNGSPPSVR